MLRALSRRWCTTPIPTRSFGLYKEIRDEWKENDAANQPMADPDHIVKTPELGEVMRQSPVTHYRAIRDSLKLYRKTLVDPEEAIREASMDDEFIRQAAERLSAQENGTVYKEGKHDESTTTATKKDMDEIMEKVKAMYPESMPQDLDGAVKELEGRKEDIKEVAIDRLEVMAGAMKEFMVGYREGKEESIKEVQGMSDADAKKYAASFLENVVAASKDESDNTGEEKKEKGDADGKKEKKEEEKIEKGGADGSKKA